MADHDTKHGLVEKIASRTVRWASGSLALFIVFAIVAIWLVAGPYLDFSDDWQSVVSTVSAAVTFPMVFLLARAQMKDTMSMQIKLNEIIAALNGANNQLINIENLSEIELAELHKRYEAVAIKVGGEGHNQISTDAIISHEIEAEIVAMAEAKAEEQKA